MIVMFADLAGYTALTDVHGDNQALAAIESFEQVVTRIATRRRLRIVKSIGDAFMLTGNDADLAIAAARELIEEMGQVELTPAVRIGIHSGPVSIRGFDVIGGTVNVAARVSSEASAGQILITADVLQLTEQRARSEAQSVGDRRLRHVQGPVELFDVCPDLRSDQTVDPVCRMLVARDTAAASVRHDGETFYFCSIDCAARFIERSQRDDDG
jgi:adenylate cyclase